MYEKLSVTKFWAEGLKIKRLEVDLKIHECLLMLSQRNPDAKSTRRLILAHYRRVFIFLVHVVRHMNSQTSSCPSGETKEQIIKPSVLCNKPQDYEGIKSDGNYKVADAPHFNTHAPGFLHAYTAENTKHDQKANQSIYQIKTQTVSPANNFSVFVISCPKAFNAFSSRISAMRSSLPKGSP